MFKRIFVLFLFLLCAGVVYGQQVPRIAVVDLSRVYIEFFPESRAVREFAERSARVQSDIDRQTMEIQVLRSRHADAIMQDNQAEMIRLETEINRRTENLRNFVQARAAELENERRNLMQSPSFWNEVNDEIRLVAESGGFSHVFNITDTPGLIWWHSTFDITDRLIQGLRNRSRN
jgi:outer membrane protein